MFGGERGEHGVRLTVGVGAAGQQQGHVPVPEPVRADAVAGARCGGFGHAHQVEVGQHVVQVGVDERVKSLPRGRMIVRSARPERGRSVQYRVLKVALAGVEKRDGQSGLVDEPPIQGPLTDTGRGGDRVHRHGVNAVPAKQRGGCVQHRGPVARSVGSFPGW